MSFEECIKFAVENPVCFLATVDGDQPRVRGFLVLYTNENPRLRSGDLLSRQDFPRYCRILPLARTGRTRRESDTRDDCCVQLVNINREVNMMLNQKNVVIRVFEPSDIETVHSLVIDTIDKSYSGVYPEEAIDFFKQIS